MFLSDNSLLFPMKKKKVNDQPNDQLENLERQFKRALKILSIFVFTVLAMAFTALIFALVSG